MVTAPRPLRSKVVATFGIVLVTLLLARPIYSLGEKALEPWLAGMLAPYQKVLWVVWFVANGYFEGYKGFQQRFAPRVVGRAAYLGDHPTPLRVILALPFCLSLFHARRAQLIFRWCFLTALYTLIMVVRFIPQPWRGIIDGGVVVGLGWGVLSVWYFFIQYLLDRDHPVATDLPDEVDGELVAAE